MLPYSQANRALRIQTPLPEGLLVLVGLEGSEAISELFQFRLELLAPAAAEVDFNDLVGKPISVSIQQEALPPRWLHGVAVELSQGRQDEEFTRHELLLAPKFWWWTQRRRSRIFQQQSVPDILRAVLDGLEPRFELAGTYPPRNYCVQYGETDYAFACRLMEEEGIFFFFEFDDEKHTLVVADANGNLPEIVPPNPVVFEPLEGGLRDEPRIRSWTKRQRIQPAKVTLWDHSFELPGQTLQAGESIQPTVQVGGVEHKLAPADEASEIYDYPGGYAKRFDGVAPGGADRSSDPPKTFQENERAARLRMQQLAARAIDIDGASNCSHLAAGRRFTLARHGNGDGDYVLTRVEHRARLAAGYRSETQSAELEYENRFAGLPLDLPYRPRQTAPRPRVAGVQTATVVGPAGSEIFCDKYGRVKVQFHWDREGNRNADSSCWIRVAQVWAGNRWGAFFWPRVGHEVVVAFLEGDPDRPLIVGSVYNAANMPPPSLPGEATIGGIKSCIFGGDPTVQFNAVVFHDTTAHQFLQLHSEKHEMQHSESNKMHCVPQGHYSFTGSF